MKEKYDWKFSTIGGVTRVNIDSGSDIAHLDELDQKLWTVLSCPVTGLELDEKSLRMLDTNGDDRIHVNEVIAASKWLVSVLKNPDLLVRQGDSIPLSEFNTGNEEGQKLLASAKQILENLGLDKNEISVENTSDSLAIFAKTRFNGDGIITEASTDDEELKAVIAQCIATVGSSADRSGAQGVNQEQIDAFYAALADYSEWMDSAEKDKEAIFPYGDDTAAALSACEAINAKVADYFMRCRLSAFNSDSTAALDVSADRIGTISERNLADCNAEISEYPIARVNSSLEMPLDINLINPAWQGAFNTVKALVLDKEVAGKKSITQAEWNGILAKFDAFKAWSGAKKGAQVESLGIDAVKTLLGKNRKADLEELIAQDKALEPQATSIEAVDKLVHLRRDFFTLLKNFVTMRDFYAPDHKAIFQAGTLYIDQRSCDMCMKVSNMGNHNTMASLSGMYLVYCDCVCKSSPAKMSIVAAITNGDIDNIMVGKNAIFYDRSGLDWDATVTKIVDNPISIRQAFWSPYRKIGKFVENQINKFAADKDSKVMADTTGKIGNAGSDLAAAEPKKTPFDIAKFAGIFAAIGMALGMLASALVSVVVGFLHLKVWQMALVIVAVLLLISGPAMIMAWLKLRKRNLAPLLNANGWAVNARVKVNTVFGATLTQVADIPVVASSNVDPFAEKRMPGIIRFLLWLIAAAAIAFVVLLAMHKLPWQNKETADDPVEQVIEEDIVPDTPAGTSLEEMTGSAQ